MMEEDYVEIEFKCVFLLTLVLFYLNLNLSFIILPMEGVPFMVHLFLNFVNST
jgi:hypothetical protein